MLISNLLWDILPNVFFFCYLFFFLFLFYYIFCYWSYYSLFLILQRYVAVRNRTQEEIDKCVGFAVARQNEEDYFNNHPELMDMPPHFKGTKQVCSLIHLVPFSTSYIFKQLATKLTQIQAERIRSILPKVRDTIRDRLRAQRAELHALPTELSSGSDCSHRLSSTFLSLFFFFLLLLILTNIGLLGWFNSLSRRCLI